MKISNAYLFADNLSLKKNASLSPIITPDPFNQYRASNAVDGNTGTCMRTSDIGTTALHKATWWKVDLGGMNSIYSINILYKNYDSLGMYLVCLNINMATGKYNIVKSFQNVTSFSQVISK